MQSEIHFYLPAFNGGGAENAMIRLLNHWCEKGRKVTLIVNQKTGPLSHRIDPKIPVHTLGSRHSLANIPALTKHLRQHKPKALVTALLSPNVTGVFATRLSGVVCPVICLVRNHTSTELAAQNPLRRILIRPLLHLAYQNADAIGCVAQSVADDLVSSFKLDSKKVSVTLNPVPLNAAGMRPADMPTDGRPVFVAIGRLVPQKDYPAVLEAFYRLQETHPSHLIILGEGEQKATLTEMVDKLGLAEQVSFLGYRENPQDYLAHCDGFVLLSKFEGFPNVVAEALAAGVGIVATNAPGGTSDILDSGKHGRLVPVGDISAATYAMQQVLDHPFDKLAQIARASEFKIEAIAARYDRLIEAASSNMPIPSTIGVTT